MLQDFLANRPAIGSSEAAEAHPRTSGFQPLFSAQSSLPPKRPEPVAETGTKRLEAPEIELVQEGGEVRRIIVTCTCCEKITIDCEY